MSSAAEARPTIRHGEARAMQDLTGRRLSVTRILIVLMAAAAISAYALTDGFSSPTPAAGIAVTVGRELILAHPHGLDTLSDEHTTIFPPHALDSNSEFVFFAASRTADATSTGAVVLQSTLAPNVIWNPLRFADGYGTKEVLFSLNPFTKCNTTFDPTFDLNYAAPGSVLRDPTLPRGNLLMLYEAENHCAGATYEFPFYATVGFVRSSDFGKTWPAPVDGEFGSSTRYPVLKVPVPQPATQPLTQAMGNAIPSAFVDDVNTSGGTYVYVTYLYYAGPVGLQGPGGVTDPRGDGKVRVARALLNGNHTLTFMKWYQGGFTQPGIGGLDTAVVSPSTPPLGGCPGFQSGAQVQSQITYNEPLKRYVLTFVCISLTSTYQQTAAAWYYATATSLALEDWSTPHRIPGTLGPVHQKGQTAGVDSCGPQSGGGSAYNGWYPSFMSTGTAAGHTSKYGYAFFMDGCDGGIPRLFKARPFEIDRSR